MNPKKSFALRFLSWFCPDHLLEEIEGDLLQKFEKNVKAFGERKAKRKLLWNVIRFFRLGIVLRKKDMPLTNRIMILNNIQFSLRYLGKHKSTAFIHIAGLTLGICVSLFIGVFVHHELTYDSHHPYSNRTFRVNSVWKESEKQFNLYATSTLLAQAIKEQVPGVKHVVRVLPQFSSVIEIDSVNRLKQERILIADPEFLDIFKIDIVSGDARKALRTPYQAIVSESTSRKLFGTGNAIGRIFKFRNEFNITVTAVMQDSPSNTNLPAEIILSYVENETFLNNGDTWYFGGLAWTKLQASTFIVFEEDQDASVINTYLNTIADRNINESPDLDKLLHGSFEIQPLADIHLDNTRFGGGPWVKAIGRNWLWLFGMIGAIVLFLASINFLNLSLAHAITRTKEISIRKVIGAKRTQLVAQLLTDALLITLTAGILAIVIAQLSRPIVSNLFNVHFDFHVLQSPILLTALFLSLLTLGVLTGIYPAWAMTKTKFLRNAKLEINRSFASWLRQGLVITQFAVSATLFISVLLIAKQSKFLHDQDLGLEKESILQLPMPGTQNANTFLNQVRQMAGVKDASLSRTGPISNDHWWNTISEDEHSERSSVCAIYGDEHFYSVYDLKLISGRIPASNELDTLTAKVVVNGKLLTTLNLGTAQEAIGKHFWWGGSTEIVGVVANFNSEPLHYEISPTLIVHDPSVYAQVDIRLEPTQSQAVLTSIESSWRQNFPDGVYEPKFLVDRIESFYSTESNVYSMSLTFAGIAIAISCMGLLGIASFVSLRRVKEISIRKVLGATSSGILALLLRQFLKPVVIATFIAFPIGWYVARNILRNYAYKVPLTWDLFAIPLITLMSIALLTVLAQTIKASLSNPANNLKSE
jgi:ABC-type antimicrobial peptide transport system permease subunit